MSQMTRFTRIMLLAIIVSGVAWLGAAGFGVFLQDKNAQVEPAPVGGPPLVRRLTESQYRASIAAIFGPDTPIVGRFEPGLRSHGLQAIGTSEAGISAFSAEQYTAMALGIADHVISEPRRETMVGCGPADVSVFSADCAERFARHYGEQLFRRPLNTEQLERYVNAARVGAEGLGDFYQGLKYALVGMLTAPEFILRIERVGNQTEDRDVLALDSYSKAERLSFFLTNRTPDAQLLRAAAAGELETDKGLAAQVDRLIASPEFEQAVRAFFTDMLEFDGFDTLVKDLDLYPAFNSQVAADAKEQTLRDIVRHLIVNGGDYRDLFVLNETELTRPLGVVYRVPIATRSGWEPYAFDDGSARSGIQSHLSFLALHSHPGRSSPTLRGEAIRKVFLCQEVPDPPADVDFSAVQEVGQGAMPTGRDRLRIHNSEPACSGCHKIMDPPGLALENFDGLGQFRHAENGAVIDASGELGGQSFESPQGMATALRNHRETPRCLAEKMYRAAVGRDTMWDERYYMDYLISQFEQAGYRVPGLMRTIALSDNFFAVQRFSKHEQYAVRTELNGVE